MQPSRILPDLQCSLLCEDVRQEVTGNFLLIGVVNFIRVPQVPITAHRLLFFNRWTAGVGEFLQSIRLQVWLHDQDKRKGYSQSEADGMIADWEADLATGLEAVDEPDDSIDADAVGLQGTLAVAEYLSVDAQQPPSNRGLAEPYRRVL